MWNKFEPPKKGKKPYVGNQIASLWVDKERGTLSICPTHRLLLNFDL